MLVVVDANTSETTITLPRPITAADGYSLRMCVQSLTLANTQLPINDYCNEITVNGVTGVVDCGNYSAANLALLLDGGFSGVNVSYDEISGKMTFAASTPFTIGGSMLDVLDVTAGTASSFTSKNNVDLSGVKGVHVVTSLQSDHISTKGIRGVVASVQMVVPPLGVLYYRDDTEVQATTLGDRHAGAGAILGPEVVPLMMAGSAAAGFGAHAYDTGNRVINTAQGVLASARRGDVNGIQRGGQSAVTDLAGLHNQYQNLRR
ncbi:hypothetical protein JKP88DRAFT_255377 [Tribonema minus]|uniref:Uncharacterized protein n=1 Tax=Tribonema minus TaxID=303371 RepID=A0A835Z2R6_9STRA|nr:hypothetical protein JKP88DRAFT_255377 [Tribonema minus]